MKPILMVWANAGAVPSASTDAAIDASNILLFIFFSLLLEKTVRLLPGAIVDCAFEGRPGLDQPPSQRPLVGVIEALAGIGLGRRVQKAGHLELPFVEQPARFIDRVAGVAPWVLVYRLGCAGFGSEHRGERRAVELVPGRFAARRM